MSTGSVGIKHQMFSERSGLDLDVIESTRGPTKYLSKKHSAHSLGAESRRGHRVSVCREDQGIRRTCGSNGLARYRRRELES